MVAIVILEIITRNVFGFSFQISDELGGYAIAAISFFGLAVCQTDDTFHHVELLQNRLSPRARAISRAIFDALAAVLCVLLLWELLCTVLQSWESGDVAMTMLATPVWLPQLVMPLGMAALLSTVLKSFCRHVRIALSG